MLIIKTLKLIISIGLFSVLTQSHAWLMECDFEGGTLGQKIDTNFAASCSHYALDLTVFSDEIVHSGSQSAKATILAGENGGNTWGAWFNYPDLYEGDEIWYRAWVYFPSNFQYNTEHGAKGLRIRTYSSGGGGKNYHNVYPGHDAVYPLNNIDISGWYANNPGGWRFPPNLNGGWECLELYVKLSSTAGNGIFRLWRGETLLIEDTQSKTLDLASDKIIGAGIFTLWSNFSSPVTQSTYFDDIAFTNEPPDNTDSYGNPRIGTGEPVEPDPDPNIPPRGSGVNVGENTGQNIGIQLYENPAESILP